jgi:hypothetical protein
MVRTIMQNIYVRNFLMAAALAGAALAQAVSSPPPPRTTGKVLLLDTGRTFEGEIELQGDQYRIRRAQGELWVPVTAHMRLCRDLHEAYELMRRQANQLDPDERLRLAHWCHRQGLLNQALAEANIAVEMRPSHQQSRQLKKLLERAIVQAKQQPINAHGLKRASYEVPVIPDVSSETVSVFTTRVQPILMNTCVNCHTGGRGGKFQLSRAFDGGQQSTTRKNLAAVLAQVNPARPDLSVLLIKAVSDHGNTGQPPIKSRKTVPYQILQSWVDNLLANNPHLRPDTDNEETKSVRSVPVPRSIPLLASPMPMLPGQSQAARAVPSESAKESDSRQAQARVLPNYVSQPPPSLPRNILETVKPSVAPKQGGSPAANNDSSGFSSQNPHISAQPVDPFDPVTFNGPAKQ